jgi:hypothetical protein
MWSWVLGESPNLAVVEQLDGKGLLLKMLKKLQGFGSCLY